MCTYQRTLEIPYTYTSKFIATHIDPSVSVARLANAIHTLRRETDAMLPHHTTLGGDWNSVEQEEGREHKGQPAPCFENKSHLSLRTSLSSRASPTIAHLLRAGSPCMFASCVAGARDHTHALAAVFLTARISFVSCAPPHRCEKVVCLCQRALVPLACAPCATLHHQHIHPTLHPLLGVISAPSSRRSR